MIFSENIPKIIYFVCFRVIKLKKLKQFTHCIVERITFIDPRANDHQ